MKIDKRQFEKFYLTHIDKVYRFVYFRTGKNVALAEDLVSEIFMKALQHFESYDVTKSTSAWIITIAKNHLANHWRDTKTTEPLPDILGDEDEPPSDSFWLKLGKKSEKKYKRELELRSLLDQLAPEEAELVTLHYISGYSYTEVAAMKDNSAGAIKVATHRIVKKLRSLV